MKELTAGDVMSTDVLAVEPDMTVHELASFLAEHQITGAPVIDPSGRLVGVVSETDLAEAEIERVEAVDDRSDPDGDVRGWEDEADPDEMRDLHLHVMGTQTVRDIMTPTAYTVPHDTPLGELARTMVTGRIHRLLVTRAGRVAGIVTTLDLLKTMYTGAGTKTASVRRARHTSAS
jgi:CBS domain-containing protein